MRVMPEPNFTIEGVPLIFSKAGVVAWFKRRAAKSRSFAAIILAEELAVWVETANVGDAVENQPLFQQLKNQATFKVHAVHPVYP